MVQTFRQPLRPESGNGCGARPSILNYCALRSKRKHKPTLCEVEVMNPCASEILSSKIMMCPKRVGSWINGLATDLWQAN